MKKYLYLSLLLLLSSLNFNLILKPLELVIGGNQGIAIIINHIFKINPAIIIFIINVISLILCYIFLSKKTVKGTLLATIIYPIFVHITSYINININLSLMVQIIVSSLVLGITSGLIYKLGYSSGGINSINLIINKYLNISIALSNFIMNSITIILGISIFGIKKGLTAIIIIIISTIIIKVLNRSSVVKT